MSQKPIIIIVNKDQPDDVQVFNTNSVTRAVEMKARMAASDLGGGTINEWKRVIRDRYIIIEDNLISVKL